MKSGFNIGFALAIGSVAVVTASCSADAPEGREGAEQVSARTQALSSVDYTDGSGKLKVRIKTCDWTTSKKVNCAYCAVDPGWVRIGGGGEILDGGTGARLKASFPSLDPAPISNCSGNGQGLGDQESTWVARSAGTADHQLRAFVVALQIVGLTESQLEAQVTTFESTTTHGTFGRVATWSAPTLDPDHTLIGGGTEVVFNTANGYLTESRPVGNSWQGSATFDTDPPDGGLKVYATSIPLCPSGLTWCLRINQRTVESSSGTGYRIANLSTPYSSVIASIGGIGTVGTTGRYLTDLIPFNGSSPGVTVSTKDFPTAVTGKATGSLITLGTWIGPANKNTVANFSGARLNRSSNLLKQTTAAPLPDSQKWHFETVSAGVYRLRNGNPGTGTDCAYYSNTSASPRVGACGSGNEFRWTVLTGGDINSLFQLRNVASGTCLDNNGAGYANADVLLKPCNGTPTMGQLFYMDAYNWPP